MSAKGLQVGALVKSPVDDGDLWHVGTRKSNGLS